MAFLAVRRFFPTIPTRVSVALLGDSEMSRLHALHLGEPTPTDVITFDLRGGATSPLSFGAELAIGVEQARYVAQRRRLPFQREVELYLVHGLLHLAGFEDFRPVDRARMRRAEGKVLASLGWGVSKLRRRGSLKSSGHR